MNNATPMSLEQALELANHASPSPAAAHQALLTLRGHIRQVESDTASAIVRSACETDPADPDHPDTIHIGVSDLQRIAEQHLRGGRSGEFLFVDVKHDNDLHPQVEAVCDRFYGHRSGNPAIGQDGAARIATERYRHQSVKGYSPEADTGYVNHELIDAAIAYAMLAGASAANRTNARTGSPSESIIRIWWPWHQSTFKPSPEDTAAARIRELEKAGALIAAEIDRLLAIPPQESHA